MGVDYASQGHFILSTSGKTIQFTTSETIEEIGVDIGSLDQEFSMCENFSDFPDAGNEFQSDSIVSEEF